LKELQEQTSFPEDILKQVIEFLSSHQSGNYIEGFQKKENGPVHYKFTPFGIDELQKGCPHLKEDKRFEQFSFFEKEVEMLEKEDLLAFISKEVSKLHVGDRQLITLGIFCGVSPWVGTQPIHPYPVGASSKGKSDLLASVLLAFPGFMHETITSSSPMAIFYAWAAGSLAGNKIIFCDDVKLDEEYIDILKNFSAGLKIKPRHWTVLDRKFVDMKPDKHYSIWLNSVNPLKDEQLKSRFLIINVDESIEQDKRVQDYIKNVYKKSRERKSIETEELKLCKNLINIIVAEENEVVIPFGFEFPLFYDRRSLIHFISMIKASAYIYKFQRPKIEDKIIAIRKDFDIAMNIWESIAEVQTKKVGKTSLTVLDMLPIDPNRKVSRADISQAIQKSTMTVKRALDEMIEMGLASFEREHGKFFYWRLPSQYELTKLAYKDATAESLAEIGLSNSDELIAQINEVVETPLIKFFKGD